MPIASIRYYFSSNMLSHVFILIAGGCYLTPPSLYKISRPTSSMLLGSRAASTRSCAASMLRLSASGRYRYRQVIYFTRRGQQPHRRRRRYCRMRRAQRFIRADDADEARILCSLSVTREANNAALAAIFCH